MKLGKVQKNPSDFEVGKDFIKDAQSKVSFSLHKEKNVNWGL